jgi:hypothetical protein
MIDQPLSPNRDYRDDSNVQLRQMDNYTRKLDLEDVKKKLKEIFIYYASYGDRLNTQNLKSAKFHKMLQDAGIMKE